MPNVRKTVVCAPIDSSSAGISEVSTFPQPLLRLLSINYSEIVWELPGVHPKILGIALKKQNVMARSIAAKPSHRS